MTPELPPFRGIQDYIYCNSQTLRFWGTRGAKHFDLVLVSLAEIGSPKARSHKINSLKTCVFVFNHFCQKFKSPLGCLFSLLGVLFFFLSCFEYVKDLYLFIQEY